MSSGPLRVVVLGDSLSVGVGDPDPALPLLAGVLGRLHGWPHHLAGLADGLGAPVELHVLARTGSRTARVRHEQLGAALALRPDVATWFTGVNDVFSPSFDADAFEADYRAGVEALVAGTRSAVLALGLHDVAAGPPLRPSVSRRVRSATAVADEVVRRVSDGAGAHRLDPDRLGLDLRSGRPVRDGVLSLDRLHPGRAGHVHLARAVAGVLQARGLLPPGALPGVPEPGPGARLGAHASHVLWCARYGPGPLLRGRMADTGGMASRSRRPGRLSKWQRAALAADEDERSRSLPAVDAVEHHRDGPWVVRRISGSTSTKPYTCPGCGQPVPPGTPHVVAWPQERPLLEREAAAARRHWHSPCWGQRSRAGR
ncbi:SGNH/GDSL hydrolase family protein [Aquipuribacter sp. SD81]|uniref:SGNH/GDSL hydrolase family protein n=1 Tax=Aquipuribacter sp. SD81 TaxID=3127703 RepID=UPI0030182DDE